jgi:hypothetical protein
MAEIKLTDIFDKIISYQQQVREKLDIVKNLETRAKQMEPDKLEKQYDSLFTVIARKENDIDGTKQTINDSIAALENCKELFSEIKIVIDEMKRISNNTKIGTLQKKTLGVFMQNRDIYPTTNPQEEEVLNQYPKGGKTMRKKMKRSISKRKKTLYRHHKKH